MSLNRYLKSRTLQFYSVYQSDTAFLIILGKEPKGRCPARHSLPQSLQDTETAHSAFRLSSLKYHTMPTASAKAQPMGMDHQMPSTPSHVKASQ